ncbi:MAG: tRNA 2-thiouridine(34) synthase MnmA [Deltaproteobacteria bacterium]|nr:tRNA 2-thiouridine(34) synthase MnmA [Deltaproteobacteria bacterium]
MTERKPRALVAMSGGVDSSVAAALLLRRGYEVVGATMRVYDYSGVSRCGTCCAPDDIHDAKRVADKLGIAHYTLNYEDRFADSVIRPFVDEYLRGRTPIPCVACNDRMKFRAMLARAAELDCDLLATGHYARVLRDGARVRLARGRDAAKDQTYFLFNLDEAQLARIDFPVGELDKASVRALAEELDLPVSHKPDSQEICFVPGGDYAAVVEKAVGDGVDLSGEIVDRAGRVVGRHDGYHRFTVGQRKGLGCLGPEPHYVLKIDSAAARVMVGKAEDVYFDSLRCDRFHWIGGAPASPVRAVVKIRHQHAGAAATIHPTGDGVRVEFERPVRAVSPGQAAVAYDGDVVRGGGFIDEGFLAEHA